MADEKVQTVYAEVIDAPASVEAPKRSGRAPRKGPAWSLLVSGVLVALLGVVCFVWPGITLETIALVVGIGFLLGGIGSIVDFAYSGAFRVFTGWLLASGIVEVLLGVVFISRPLMSAYLISWFVAIAIVAAGALQLFFAFRMYRQGGKLWLVEVATGILTVVLGILVIANPATLAYWISAFTIVCGVSLAVLAFRVSKLGFQK